MRRVAAILMFTLMLSCGLTSQAGAQFTSAFDRTADRPWPGPEYWANPLQDWRIAGAALECITAGPARSLILLTRELSDRPAPFTSSIAIAAWVGFRLAARGRLRHHHVRSPRVHNHVRQLAAVGRPEGRRREAVSRMADHRPAGGAAALRAAISFSMASTIASTTRRPFSRVASVASPQMPVGE